MYKKTVEIGINENMSSMFGQYFKSSNPNGSSENTHLIIKQAFYSGALSVLAFLSSDKLPEDEIESLVKLEQLYTDCMNELKAKENYG